MAPDSKKPPPLQARRRFIKKLIGLISAAGLGLSSIAALLRTAYAKTRRLILPKGTKMSSLVNKNPADLDARNLDTIPLKDFGTMGLADYEADMKTWRLTVSGQVKNPLELTYDQLRGLPAIERKVLLICPGFFSNYGLWKGVSVMQLLKLAAAEPGITHVSFRGPAGRYEKVEQFPLSLAAAERVFLAYQVNGRALPRKHGFPLRVVAEDRYGFQWVKFVHAVEFHKIKDAP